MPEFVASDGARIVYDDVGSGRPLLLVHGWATHAGFFAPQAQALSRDFRVIALDQRAHGRSRRPGERPGIQRLADDVRELAAALDLRGALAVGWSMGAMVLWRALLDGAAERLAGMAVVDMSPRVTNGGGWTLGLRGGHARDTAKAIQAMTRDWSAYSPRIARRIFAAGLDGERAALTAWAAAEIDDNDPAAMASLWASLSAEDFRDALAGLALPCLVLYGLRSQLYAPETAAHLGRLIRGARTLAFDRSGHAPHLEEPERFNTAITEFAAGLPQGPAASTPRSGEPGRGQPNTGGSP